MKRSAYIFPLMAFTALSLTLAGCDENKSEDTAADTGVVQSVPADTSLTTAPAVTDPVQTAAATPVAVTNAYAYATAEGATTGAIFMTLNNANTMPAKLVAARTSKAPRVEIHESYVDEADGTMQMRQVQSVDVPSAQPVELKPGGYHIMLLDLTEPLVEGQSFETTLSFEDGSEVVVPVSITAPGTSATDAMGAEMTTPDPMAHDHLPDDGSAVAPSTTTDVPVTEAPSDSMTVDEATPDPTPEAVPSDEPVTDVPAAQ